MDIVYWCSIDIGKKNFAFLVECFSKKEIQTIENIPVLERYNPDGTPTEKMQKILEAIYSTGKIVLHDNVDLTMGCDKNKSLDQKTFHNLNELLDKYKNILDKCDTILIEKQMSFGKKINLIAIKLAQHCMSYFIFRYGTSKTLLEYDSFHKTQILGAPKVTSRTCKNGKTKYKSMEKTQRKKWAVEKALEICKLREDTDTFNKISSSKKKDDLSDVLVQLQSAKYLLILAKHSL